MSGAMYHIASATMPDPKPVRRISYTGRLMIGIYTIIVAVIGLLYACASDHFGVYGG